MDSIDKLLAELKTEYEEPIKPKYQQQVGNNYGNVLKSPIEEKSKSLIDNLLAEVKVDFDEKDLAEKLEKEKELEVEKAKQREARAKELEKLKKHAQEWLKQLDPFSPEGLWFERFSEGYADKLEAAMEYLQIN
jgi:thiamine pyrophosphate-dependent acetolactate synthase large subunit-like protein